MISLFRNRVDVDALIAQKGARPVKGMEKPDLTILNRQRTERLDEYLAAEKRREGQA